MCMGTRYGQGYYGTTHMMKTIVFLVIQFMRSHNLGVLSNSVFSFSASTIVVYMLDSVTTVATSLSLSCPTSLGRDEDIFLCVVACYIYHPCLAWTQT